MRAVAGRVHQPELFRTLGTVKDQIVEALYFTGNRAQGYFQQQWLERSDKYEYFRGKISGPMVPSIKMLKSGGPRSISPTPTGPPTCRISGSCFVPANALPHYFNSFGTDNCVLIHGRISFIYGDAC